MQKTFATCKRYTLYLIYQGKMLWLYPCDWHGLWVECSFLFLVSKSLECQIGSDLPVGSFQVSQAPKQLCEAVFLSSSFSQLPSTSPFPMLPCFNSLSKNLGCDYPLLYIAVALSVTRNKWLRDTERRNKSKEGVTPPTWDHRCFDFRGSFSSIIETSRFVVPTAYAAPRIFGESAQEEKSKRKKNQHGFFTLSLTIGTSLYLSGIEQQCFSGRTLCLHPCVYF